MNLVTRYILTAIAVILTMSTANSVTDRDTDIIDASTFMVPKDITAEVDFGYGVANRKASDIDVIVVHSCHYLGTDSFSTEGCIEQFRECRVAPHYLISRDGSVIKMVDESNIARHAGRSLLPGTHRTGLNASSIGIEIINTRTVGPNYLQYRALCRLVKDICKRQNIHYVVRHSDIAPDRKDDPWCFNWHRFKSDISQTLSYLEFPSAPINEPLMAQAH